SPTQSTTNPTTPSTSVSQSALGSQTQSSTTGPSASAVKPGPLGLQSGVVGVVRSSPPVSVTEHRQLFSRYNTSNRTRNTFVYSGKGKGPAKGRVPTCTLKFVCLARVDTIKPPGTIKERTTLGNAGLGEKSVQLDANANQVQFMHNEMAAILSQILGNVPQLAETGYDVLLYQRGEDGGFFRIELPYTPKRLKDTACNAKIYLRPLQRDLILQKVDSSAKESERQADKQLILDDLVDSKKNLKNVNCGIDIISVLKSDVGGKQRKTSCDGPTKDEQINYLKEMFPEWEEESLEKLLYINGSPDAVALLISTQDRPQETATQETCDEELPETDDEDDMMHSPFAVPVTLQSLLREVRHNLTTEKVKLKVDQEDLLNDAMAFYKDPDFNPKNKLRVIFNKQPAADTGGVTRQFFTQLLSMMSTEFFQGDKYKQPIYNANMIACSIMKLCGTIVVHSILLGGPGLPIFSAGVYHYLATGDIDTAVEKMTIDDCSLHVKSFISMIAEAPDVTTVDKELVIQMLSDCGLTVSLTNGTKMEIIHSIIVHDAFSRPKILLDQFREGLSTLGFAKQVQKHPDIFKPLFVQDNASVSYVDVARSLRFPSTMEENEASTRNLLKEFLKQASNETLSNFLIFTTGAPCLPNFGLGQIEVKFDNIDSIFASTCLQRVTLPNQFPDQGTFFTVMDSVLNTFAKSFTNV
ncbi:hypothetical protein QZH41_015073, partial [Actinostola sp. cb2023]